MPVYVGLLRAVNVGGRNPVKMGELSALLSRMGFEEVQTLLQSGNVVFRCEERDPRGLERDLEGKMARDLRVHTDFFLRTAQEWRSVVAGNPFVQEAETDPGRLQVLALKEAPPPEAWKSLDAAIQGRERARGAGRTAYIFYPDGTGRSRLTPAIIEKILGTRGTSRNWNTVTKLSSLASSL